MESDGEASLMMMMMTLDWVSPSVLDFAFPKQ
jgi:hypothetical protein